MSNTRGLHALNSGRIDSQRCSLDLLKLAPNSMQNEDNNKPLPVDWVNKSDIARHFKCSVRHVNELMNRRILPFLKIGRFVRFDLAACDEAMKKYQTDSLFA